MQINIKVQEFTLNKYITCQISGGTREKVIKQLLERVTRQFLRDISTFSSALMVTAKFIRIYF